MTVEQPSRNIRFPKRPEGPAFGYETSSPARDSVFAGAGISAQFGDRWTGFLYYNVDFGRQDYFGNSVSGGLDWKF